MGLFGGSKSSDTGSADPEIRQVEKMVATEARSDQKTLDHAFKGLAKLNDTHDKAIKSAEKAQRSLDKAVKHENKTAKDLNEAEHKHENAIAGQRNAFKTLELKQQQGELIEQDLQQRRASVDELQQKKAVNDAARETRLSQIHHHAAESARTRSDDFGSRTESGGRTSVDEHGVKEGQGAGTGTVGVDANGTAISGGDRV